MTETDPALVAARRIQILHLVRAALVACTLLTSLAWLARRVQRPAPLWRRAGPLTTERS
jgi:hypothetical protein